MQGMRRRVPCLHCCMQQGCLETHGLVFKVRRREILSQHRTAVCLSLLVGLILKSSGTGDKRKFRPTGAEDADVRGC